MGMSEPRKRESKPKNVVFLNTYLACQRCTSLWQVIDLNPELRVVKCPTCAEPNDIREAIKRAE
jgi:transcription elongation factor Elf1